MRQHERGEIATLLTIGTLVVIGVTAVVSSLFVNQQKTTRSKAACPATQCEGGSGTCADVGKVSGIYKCCAANDNPLNTGWTWATWSSTGKCASDGAPSCGGKDQPCCKEGTACKESSLSCQSNTCKEATGNGGGASEKHFSTATECASNCKVSCHQCMQQARVFPSTAVLGAATTYGSKLLAGANLCCNTSDLKTDGGGSCDNKLNKQGACDPACCKTNSDCPAGQTCTISNGNCVSSNSCNDHPDNPQIKKCVDNKCVYAACTDADKPCVDKCSQPSECASTTGCSKHNCSEVPGHSEYTGNYWYKDTRYYADDKCTQDKTDYGIGVWCASLQNSGNNNTCKTASLYVDQPSCEQVFGKGSCHSCNYGVAVTNTKWEPNDNPSSLPACSGQTWQTSGSCNCQSPQTCNKCNSNSQILFMCSSGTTTSGDYGTAKCQKELGSTAYCNLDTNHECKQGDAQKENLCGTSQTQQTYRCCVPTGDHNGGETPKGDGCSWVTMSTGGGVKSKCTASTGSDAGKCRGTCDGSNLDACKCNAAPANNDKHYTDQGVCNQNCNAACYSCTFDEGLEVRAHGLYEVLGIADPVLAAIQGWCCNSPKTGTNGGETPKGDGCSWYSEAMSGKVKTTCGKSSKTEGGTCTTSCSGSTLADCKCSAAAAGTAAGAGPCKPKYCRDIDNRYTDWRFYDNGVNQFETASDCSQNKNAISNIKDFCGYQWGLLAANYDNNCHDQTKDTLSYCQRPLEFGCKAGFKESATRCGALGSSACCVQTDAGCTQKNCQLLDSRYPDTYYYEKNGKQYWYITDCNKGVNQINAKEECGYKAGHPFNNYCIAQTHDGLSYCQAAWEFGCKDGFVESATRCGVGNTSGCCIQKQTTTTTTTWQSQGAVTGQDGTEYQLVGPDTLLDPSI